MWGRSFPFANADLHVDESCMIIPPREITSATKNFHQSRYRIEDRTLEVSVNQNKNGSSARLASVNNFESKKERRQCGGKYRWNSYIAWVFFLQNFLLIYATYELGDPKQCALGIRTPGRTWPKGDIMLEHGQPLRIYCILNENLMDPRFRDRNASDLVFFRGDTVMESKYVNVVNETTAMMHVDQPPPSNDMYFCSLKLNDSYNIRPRYEAVCLNSVTIGFKPLKPENFNCVSHNWVQLVCSWNPVPNYIATRFSLAFRLPGRAGRSMLLCPQAPRGSDHPPNTCIWNLSTHPGYRHVYPHWTFVLTAENNLGMNRFIYDFDHFAHVIPAQPDNLSVINKTCSSALLYWKVPLPMAFFPPGLDHRVYYQNQRDSRENWQTIDVEDQKHRAEIYFNLTDLQHANTVYIVRVSLRSSKAVDEDKWGQFSEVIFKTAPTLPGLPPKTDIGSFEIARNGDSRDVYIYWQAVPQYLENADNFTYQVAHVEENGRTLDLQPHEVTRSYAKFEGISHNSLTFDIVATNCKGASEHKATVRVPRQLEMPQKPVVFTKIAFESGIYELSWSSSSNPDIVDYTIFWCENDRDRPYQCSGYLDWIHVPKNTLRYNMTVPDPKKIYQFAIAANTAQASSGMAWVSSMTTLSNVVGKMKSVWITRIESDLFQIGWELEYSGRIGSIESFNIHYCPIVSANNMTCSDPKMITTVMFTPHTLHGDIRNLKPNTTYSITVAVKTMDGEGLHSDAIYVTTLKNALDQGFKSTNFIDTPLKLARVLADVNVSAKIEQRSSKEHCNGDIDCELDGIDATNSNSADCLEQVTNLTQTISVREKKLNFLMNENLKLRDSLLKCNEIR